MKENKKDQNLIEETLNDKEFDLSFFSIEFEDGDSFEYKPDGVKK